MKKKLLKLFIFSTFIILIISCKNKDFELPTNYSCFKYNEADSIIDNYYLNNKNLNNEFKTMFGFEIFKPIQFNQEKLISKSKNNKISVGDKTQPFYITFSEFNNSTMGVQIEIENIHKKLYKEAISLKQKNHEIELNLQNRINDKYESITTTFNNLLENLNSKYGKFNFQENSTITKDISDKNYLENEYKFMRYYWIIDDVLITLKHETIFKDEFDNNDNELRIKAEKEFVVLSYQSISLTKSFKEDINNEWKEKTNKEVQKSEKIEKVKDSFNQIEKNKLSKEL
jgi:hypothetical protein